MQALQLGIILLEKCGVLALDTCTAVERANGGMRSSSFLGLTFSILRLVKHVYTVSSSVCTAPSLKDKELTKN
jgi:hypothetical protein